MENQIIDMSGNPSQCSVKMLFFVGIKMSLTHKQSKVTKCCSLCSLLSKRETQEYISAS